jgi:hypothetical protein
MAKRKTGGRTSSASDKLRKGIFEFDPAADPKKFKPHKMNWRKHSHRQRSAFNAHKARVGWTDAVIVNVTTGNIVDGHMRHDEAIRKGETIPVLYGRWTKEEELEILATKDPLGMLAETQADALQSLNEQIHGQIEEMQGKHKDTLKKLVADIDTFAEEIASGEAPRVALERKRDRKEYDRARQVAKDEEPENVEDEDQLEDDPIFSSSHAFGIPDLLPELLCTEVPRTIWDRSVSSTREDAWYCYSAGPGTIPAADSRSGGFLGFFTEDFRFERTWNDSPGFTEWLRDMDFAGVAAPDFSTWADWPLTLRLYNIYRSRWCARYWQEAGIPVIPIIQSIGRTKLDSAGPTSNSFSAEVCLRSLPKKIPVLATEARNSQGKEDYWIGWANLHKPALSILQVKQLVIYGGEENQKRFLGRLGRVGKTELVLLSSFISRRRKGDKKKD